MRPIRRDPHEPRAQYYLAVTRLDKPDKVVGFARLGFAGVRAAKLGYAVAADYQGSGFATDAVRTVLDVAFGPLDRHRVSAAIGPETKSSLAVAGRTGFTREGLYAILAHEWTPQPVSSP